MRYPLWILPLSTMCTYTYIHVHIYMYVCVYIHLLLLLLTLSWVAVTESVLTSMSATSPPRSSSIQLAASIVLHTSWLSLEHPTCTLTKRRDGEGKRERRGCTFNIWILIYLQIMHKFLPPHKFLNLRYTELNFRRILHVHVPPNHPSVSWKFCPAHRTSFPMHAASSPPWASPQG